MGNFSCRMAHSCNPTCFTVTMGAGPQLTLAIYTTRAVAQVHGLWTKFWVDGDAQHQQRKPCGSCHSGS
jgi:hypothetical protein